MAAEVVLLNDITLRSAYRVNRYIGPYALASRLQEAGISCQVIDWFTDIPDFFEYFEPFLGPETKVVGIASTFLTQPLKARRDSPAERPLRTDQARNYFSGYLWFNEEEELVSWLEQLRSTMGRLSPQARLVLGGAKAMYATRAIQEGQKWVGFFDAILVGAADSTLVQYVQEGAPANLAPAVIHGGAINAQGDCRATHWDRRFAILPGEALPVEISRGCVFNCRFCHYEKRSSEMKSVEDLREEFIRNYELFGTTGYHFCDDCFNDRRSKVEQICNMILGLPFKMDWISYARIDLAARVPETMDLMVESGGRGVWLGLESFNAEAARSAGKGVHPDQVKEALLQFRSKYRNECLFAASFITGLPGETETSQLDTLDWILKNDILDFASFGVLGLLQYDASQDGKAMDYAEYTRNPEKYGFKKVSWEPYYWEHDTMNSEVAQQLAEHCQAEWGRKQGSVFFKFLWAYPTLKSYGFSHPEILDMARNPLTGPTWEQKVRQKREARDLEYWNLLRTLAKGD